MIGNNSQHSDHSQPLSEINVTPLVDVMLVLLVIFILTAPLLAQSIQVNLPKTVATPPTQQPIIAHLTLHANGHYDLDGKTLNDDTLVSSLSERLTNTPDLVLSLKADAAVPYERVAQLLALAQQAGLQRLSLSTQAQ